jgi:predicted Zn-dependent protease
MASLQATLGSAQFQIQRGHLHIALKLYRGLWALVPHHEQVNSELGALLLLMGKPQKALFHLHTAYKQGNASMSLWLNYLIANHKTGNLVVARELLAFGPSMGIDSQHIEDLQKVINQPSKERQEALQAICSKGDLMEAEIAARLYLKDYPDHELGVKTLEQIELAKTSAGKAA